MEPGLRDREYQIDELVTRIMLLLQWSPVLETGNTRYNPGCQAAQTGLQWSPVLETGNTMLAPITSWHRDRLQWSPVLETGNTRPTPAQALAYIRAAMEPGLRDREYVHGTQWSWQRKAPAAMEPGLRDREYPASGDGNAIL